ncbi:MAG: DUF4062 domain-containing protein [Acidimicrobiia bacterium]|nr:DUF4062 domain-containing protein [Acidimicrobiia bacterium]
MSSTMYDLSDLRGRVREFIEGLGWRAVMAEHGSFSVDAAETTVENSLRNVRENADVFVMVVGARYGSVDPGADKSVTRGGPRRGVGVRRFGSRFSNCAEMARAFLSSPHGGLVDSQVLDPVAGGPERYSGCAQCGSRLRCQQRATARCELVGASRPRREPAGRLSRLEPQPREGRPDAQTCTANHPRRSSADSLRSRRRNDEHRRNPMSVHARQRVFVDRHDSQGRTQSHRGRDGGRRGGRPRSDPRNERLPRNP